MKREGRSREFQNLQCQGTEESNEGFQNREGRRRGGCLCSNILQRLHQ